MSFPSDISSISNQIIGKNKDDRILSTFPVQAKVIEFMRHWMQRYWEKDWKGRKKLIAYVRKFCDRITRAYENDENWEPIEVKNGTKLCTYIHSTTYMLVVIRSEIGADVGTNPLKANEETQAKKGA